MSAGTVLNPSAGREVIASATVARLARDRLAAAAGTQADGTQADGTHEHPARGDAS